MRCAYGDDVRAGHARLWELLGLEPMPAHVAAWVDAQPFDWWGFRHAVGMLPYRRPV